MKVNLLPAGRGGRHGRMQVQDFVDGPEDRFGCVWFCQEMNDDGSSGFSKVVILIQSIS